MSSHLQRHVGKCGVSVTSPLLLFFVLLFPLCTCVKAQKKQQSTLYTRKRDPSSSSLAFSTNQTRKEKRTREDIVWQLASLPLSHFLPVLLSLMGVTAIHLSGSFSLGCLGKLVVCGRGSSLGLCQRVCAIARAVL